MWRCKDCGTSVSRRSELLKHYKLDHRHYGRRHSYPCIYFHCPCTCKTWNALLSHLSSCHQRPPQTEPTTFKCLLCNCNQISTLKGYFQHIAQHLKNSETVDCVFQGCSYRTNIYGSFRTHRSRNHRDSLENHLKPGFLVKQGSNVVPSIESHHPDSPPTFSVSTDPSDNVSTEDLGDSYDVQNLNDLPHTVELKVACL